MTPQTLPPDLPRTLSGEYLNAWDAVFRANAKWTTFRSRIQFSAYLNSMHPFVAANLPKFIPLISEFLCLLIEKRRSTFMCTYSQGLAVENFCLALCFCCI